MWRQTIRCTAVKLHIFSADSLIVLTADELIEKELMWNRFNRLTTELMRGGIARTTFQPWEVDLLLDAGSCTLEPKRRVEILQQYRRAVNRQLDDGPGPPMRLSEYLQQSTTRRP